VTVRRKLIEVALPLDAINAESAREKSGEVDSAWSSVDVAFVVGASSVGGGSCGVVVVVG
jgi:hypothetical protein